jgi:hypothetical protein
MLIRWSYLADVIRLLDDSPMVRNQEMVLDPMKLSFQVIRDPLNPSYDTVRFDTLLCEGNWKMIDLLYIISF